MAQRPGLWEVGEQRLGACLAQAGCVDEDVGVGDKCHQVVAQPVLRAVHRSDTASVEKRGEAAKGQWRFVSLARHRGLPGEYSSAASLIDTYMVAGMLSEGTEDC